MTAARTIAVASGKGGVGTSTVAALLGAAIAADGRRVLLVDGVGRLGTLHELLGVSPLYSLGALRSGVSPEMLVSPVSPTLSLLVTAPDEQPLPDADRRVLYGRLVSLYDGYDCVVTDVGSSAASILQGCRDGATRLLAVAGADRVGLAATFALFKLVTQHAPAVPIELVANRMTAEIADTVHGHLNAAAIRFLSRTIPLAGVIPEDADFGSALAAGLSAVDAAVGSNAVAAIQPIGQRLLSETSAPSRAGASLRSFRKR
ncbi:MAG: P-loop NTPase [Gemmatimonadaceae bacterium]